MKPFEVFRTGKHKGSNGREIVVTREMLDEIATNYNSASDQAPIVVGHPKTNDPAYGWVERFSVSNDVLIAHPDQVETQFEELVGDGRYKKRSISLYAPDSESNPVPGQYFPRHVGFLGAKAPAIGGLKDVAFTADDAADDSAVDFSTDFEDAAEKQSGWHQAVDNIASGLKTILGVDFASNPDVGVTKIITPKPKQEDIMKTKNKEATADFEQKQADLEAGQAELKQQQAEFAQAETDRRAADDKELIDSLEKDGKVPPGAKAGLLAFMAELPASDDCTIEFSQGDDKIKQTPHVYFRDIISGANAQINFSEVSAKDGGGGDGEDDAEAIKDKALEFQAQRAKSGIEVSYLDAVEHVTKGN